MKRCLIIDASAIVRKVTGIILADFGFETIEASTGQAGLAEIALKLPELAVVDAHMTDVPALDVLRRIRSASGGSVYVLYCTTTYDIIDLQRAHAAGASDVLIKPFDRASLATKLDAWTISAATARPDFFSRLTNSDLKRIA